MKSKSNIRDIIEFLQELSLNNDRTWFKAHKDQYDALRKPWEEDMERLITLVGQWEPDVRSLQVKDSVYRIYRDIRFSHDKSPYKKYFSGVIAAGGRHTRIAGSYVHFEPGNIMLGGGIWWPEKEILNQLRSLIDAEGEEFLHIINNPAIASRYQWDCETLKKMPVGYPADHPLGKYLKMKEYIMMMRPSLDYFDCDDWVERVASDLQPLKPLYDFLNYVFD